MKFLIIGAGLIGKERIKALLRLGYEDIYVYDINVPKDLDPRVKIADDNSLKDTPPTWVFISTPHSAVKDWVRVAANWGSKILIEKPMGRNLQEAEEIHSYIKYPSRLFVGFNYRFYPGIISLTEDVLNERFGKIVSINMILGHGGSPTDKDYWKLNTFDGSSDCLLDPGIHFLDIIDYMFPGRVQPLFGKYWKGFWNTGIKEEVYMVYDINGFPMTLNTSLVRWRSTFCIEVNGTDGYGIVTGKGRSYGDQIYVRGDRWGWRNGKTQKDSEEIVLQATCDRSFYLETQCLLSSGNLNCTGSHALQVMKLYDESIRVLI